MKTPLTKEKLQNHFTYSLWKYALLALIAIFGWNLMYSMTAYQAPEEKKVVMGAYSFGSEDNINAYMEKVRVELMPDMEEMYASYIAADATYGDMILSTRIAARDCDIPFALRGTCPRSTEEGVVVTVGEYANEATACPVVVSRMAKMY